MPLFVYKCLKCLKVYEIIVPLAKLDKKIRCPHCKKALKKEISSVFFRVN